MGFHSQNFVRRSDIVSVLSGRPGLLRFDVNSDFAALVYKSQLKGAILFLSSGSQSTQTLRCEGYLVNLVESNII